MDEAKIKAKAEYADRLMTQVREIADRYPDETEGMVNAMFGVMLEVAARRDANTWAEGKIEAKNKEIADWQQRYYELHDVLRTYENALDAARATIVLNIFDQIDRYQQNYDQTVEIPRLIEWFNIVLKELDPPKHK